MQGGEGREGEEPESEPNRPQARVSTRAASRTLGLPASGPQLWNRPRHMPGRNELHTSMSRYVPPRSQPKSKYTHFFLKFFVFVLISYT